MTSISLRREELIKSVSVFFPFSGTLVAVTACDTRFVASNTCCLFVVFNSGGLITIFFSNISLIVSFCGVTSFDKATSKLLTICSSFSFLSSIFFSSSCAEEPKILAKFSSNFFSSIGITLKI